MMEDLELAIVVMEVIVIVLMDIILIIIKDGNNVCNNLHS